MCLLPIDSSKANAIIMGVTAGDTSILRYLNNGLLGTTPVRHIRSLASIVSNGTIHSTLSKTLDVNKLYIRCILYIQVSIYCTKMLYFTFLSKDLNFFYLLGTISLNLFLPMLSGSYASLQTRCNCTGDMVRNN